MEEQNKIKELTDKIYREGLDKANKEAERIIHEARNNAEIIVNKAQEEAENIINEADKKAVEMTERIHSEFRLSIQQALQKLRKEISDLIQAEVLRVPLQEAFEDTEFIKKIIEMVIRNWNPEGNELKLNVLLPKDHLKDAETYFRNKTADLMNKGLSLKDQDGIERGFEIQPQNGHYKISITDESFEAFLRDHFKSKAVEFLFGGKKP